VFPITEPLALVLAALVTTPGPAPIASATTRPRPILPCAGLAAGYPCCFALDGLPQHARRPPFSAPAPTGATAARKG